MLPPFLTSALFCIAGLGVTISRSPLRPAVRDAEQRGEWARGLCVSKVSPICLNGSSPRSPDFLPAALSC